LVGLSSLTASWQDCRWLLWLTGCVTTTLVPNSTATASTPPPRWHGPSETRRERIGLALLLILTAVMYLWNITINAMGNQFYAGAAQA
jgi:hypothetical protein